MRKLLRLACRAFPPAHRARRSDEVVDTALLAAQGSAWSAVREGVSLVVAGLRQRLRAESGRSLRDGFGLLAGTLAVVNLAVALAGVALGVHHPPLFLGFGLPASWMPYVVDWWWIAFTVAAAGIVFGLVLGNRRLALGAGIANLGIVGYDALFLVNGTDWYSGHLVVFSLGQPGPTVFPVGRYWLAAAIVLVLATAAAPLRRLPLRRLPLAFVAALLLVVLSREISGSFLFLLWPLTATVVLAMVFGGLAPRLAVLAVGGVLVALPSVVWYSIQASVHPHPVVRAAVAAGLAVGLLLPLAHLTRRRLT
jgi:hypothetical protein